MNNKKADFDAAAFAHDVKTPLSTIKGFLSTTGLTEDDMEVYRGAAKRSLEKIIMMVDEIREASKRTSNNFSHRDIAAITCGTVEELKPIAIKQGINVHYIGPENLICKIDAVSISRTIANLVLNAIEASKSGGEVLAELSARDDSVKIMVSDQGVGIDESAIPFVFERGFTAGKQSGTGIGLSVCKETVEKHLGSIDVKSKKGSGTVFTITLPTLRDKAMTAHFRPSSANVFAVNSPWIEDTLD